MLDLSSLDLDDIATALADQDDYDHRWLIDPLPPYVWYQDMADFVERISDVRAERRAVEWLMDHDLVDGAAARRFLDDHPDPDLP